MTRAFRIGRYSAGSAATSADIVDCQRLRHLCFFGHDGIDQDSFDPACSHMMVHDQDTGRLVCTFRYQCFRTGHEAKVSYAAQSYDMKKIFRLNAPMIEIGRFCCEPGVINADVLRIAWAALTQVVDDLGAQMLFGCSSFPGIDPVQVQDAFAALARRHIGPPHLRPGPKAPQTIPLDASKGTPRDGLLQMPPLLKTYLTMGGVGFGPCDCGPRDEDAPRLYGRDDCRHSTRSGQSFARACCISAAKIIARCLHLWSVRLS